jgi:methylmalonyl-CoA mutase
MGKTGTDRDAGEPAHCQHRQSKAGTAKTSVRPPCKTEISFGELMETVKYCSLGEITGTLFNVGGQYRRNM